MKDWPSYLLRNIPPDLRQQLSERADKDVVSLADVIRQALCHHYRMDCKLVSYRYQPQLDTGGDIILIRIQPEVYRLIKRDTRNRYGALRKLILDSLTTYLEHEEEPEDD